MLDPSADGKMAKAGLIKSRKGDIQNQDHGDSKMKLTYTENPHPAINLINEAHGFTMKSIGVAGIKEANVIANARGLFKLSDLMDSAFSTGADIIKEYKL